MDCKLIFEEVNNYISNLEIANCLYKRQIEEISAENTRLLESEKDMFKVSTIITTSNENAKLKSYITILEKQLNKYKEDSKKTIHVTESVEHEVTDKVEHEVTDKIEAEVTDKVEHEDTDKVEHEDTDKVEAEINVTYTIFKYKEVEYVMDEERILHKKDENGVVGEIVGKRKYNKKTGKWKTILLTS
jgi:hypothetical protein